MRENRAGPHIFVIFGGTGDLSRRKLLPAISNLSKQGLLPDEGSIVLGVARDSEHDDESFRALVFS